MTKDKITGDNFLYKCNECLHYWLGENPYDEGDTRDFTCPHCCSEECISWNKLGQIKFLVTVGELARELEGGS